MADETLTCGVRSIPASDGTWLPVPSGLVGGLYDEYGLPITVSETAEVRAFPYGSGYHVVVNAAVAENSEAQELFDDLSSESIEYMVEKVFLEGAPRAFKLGLSVIGLIADVLTTSKLTREIFIRGEYEGVPITYCVLV